MQNFGEVHPKGLPIWVVSLNDKSPVRDAGIIRLDMKENKDVKISYWAAHLTTIVSVTLVLIIVGIIALITLSAERETRRLKEKLEISVVMADSVSNNYARKVADGIANTPYALQVGLVTKEDALASWKQDTGEDLEALFGVNPLSPEVIFSLRSDYASSDSLAMIKSQLLKTPGVEDIAMPDSMMVESMNRNIENFAIMLGVIALVMVIISFVLINNTVHLAIYARRFTIHTMQLVGATNGFIRAPFVKSNMLAGLIAGLVASGIMAVALAAAPRAGFNDVANYISWPLYAAVAGGMILAGILLCGLAAAIATTRYLGKDYDELFH